jgi:hypothetical protein
MGEGRRNILIEGFWCENSSHTIRIQLRHYVEEENLPVPDLTLAEKIFISGK